MLLRYLWPAYPLSAQMVKVAVLLDSSREFQVTTSDLNHGRVERSSIPQSTETSARIPSVHLIYILKP
jgi:hypothetical protein